MPRPTIGRINESICISSSFVTHIVKNVICVSNERGNSQEYLLDPTLTAACSCNSMARITSPGCRRHCIMIAPPSLREVLQQGFREFPVDYGCRALAWPQLVSV